MSAPELRLSRRAVLGWIAVVAGLASMRRADAIAGHTAGYGSDPNLLEPRAPWPRVMTERQRALARALCDTILPAHDQLPSGGDVGLTDFFDEWVSAPYPVQSEDRALLLPGLEALVGANPDGFLALDPSARLARFQAAAGQSQHQKFCERFRTLAAAAYFTTPVGVQAIGYGGGAPAAAFDGVPAATVARLEEAFRALPAAKQGVKG